jgi:signal transduction histidine kinase
MVCLVRKLEWLCLLAMAAAVVVIGWELARYGAGGEAGKWLGAAGMLMLVLAAGGAVWVDRRNVRAGLGVLRRQLRELGGRATPRMMVDRSDATPEAIRPLAAKVDELRREMEELRSTNCSLDVRYRIAEARREQAEGILRISSDLVIVVNRFGELVFANEAAAKAFDFPMGESLRRKIEDVVGDTALVRELRQALQGGRAQPRRVVEVVCHAGERQQTFHVLLQSMKGTVAGTSAIVAVMRDISGQTEAERAQSEFVSSVSHELKTPLASIKAYTEMLLDGEISAPSEMRQCYETMALETDRLASMIERLLNLSRLQSAGFCASLEPVSMTAVLRQVLSVLSPQAGAKHLALREQLAPVFYQVEADYDLLCQAMMNLIGNAIKYTPEGGEVVVHVAPDASRQAALVEVTDTGPGIPAEELPKIFEKFYRVRSTKHMAPGTGLGLALTKYIIETIHGGQLSVTSEVGRGTTFSFQLPLVL